MDSQLLTYYEMPLPNWQCVLTTVVTESGIYCPIIDLCSVLGIIDHKQQVAYLRGRTATAAYIEQFAIPTKTRGKQLKTCIHQKAIGFWLGYIHENRVRPEIRGALIELQQDILEASYRYVLGDIPGLHRRIGLVKAPISIPESDEDE